MYGEGEYGSRNKVGRARVVQKEAALLHFPSSHMYIPVHQHLLILLHTLLLKLSYSLPLCHLLPFIFLPLLCTPVVIEGTAT